MRLWIKSATLSGAVEGAKVRLKTTARPVRYLPKFQEAIVEVPDDPEVEIEAMRWYTEPTSPPFPMGSLLYFHVTDKRGGSGLGI